MARSSKDTSNPGTPGFLFGAAPEEDKVEQTSPEQTESRPVKPSRKRASRKSKQIEEAVVPQEPTQEFGLFTAPDDSMKSDNSDASNTVETLSNQNPGAPSSSEAPKVDADPLLNSTPEKNGAAPETDNKSPSEIEDVQLDVSEPELPQEDVPPTESEPVDVRAASVSDDPLPAPTSVLREKPAAYQVVARRYRPQVFDELIGQETVARALSNAIEQRRVGHAYLFTGARGVGKTSCARIFAKALNCIEGPTTHPCLKCDSCIAISTGEDVDVIEIDGASNRGVDEIRQLRQNAAIAPSRSHYKIYIIDEVHMLTREAFNALLKTLEEPPARVKFIFCTTEPNKIPVTILSRCQRFDFNSINGTSITQRLEQIARQEGAQAEDGVFEVLARRANGSMRDAQSLLEQLLSFAPEHITVADVHNMLGSVDDSKIFALLDAIVQGNAGKVFEILAGEAALGVDFGTLVEQTFGVYRDLMIVASGCGVRELAYSSASRFDDLKKIAETFGIRRILASLQILDQTIQRMRYSAQARILAELAFARLCQLDAFQVIESLIAQLKNGAISNVPLTLALPDVDTATPDGDKKKN